MPELPEVETIVRSLRNGGMTGEPILNRQINSVDCFNAKTLVFDGTCEECTQVLSGRRILSVERRAKYIHIRTEKPSILIHLRMSGDLRCEPESEEPYRPHDRLVFHFSDEMRLVFNDVRKFGRVWVTDDPNSVLKDLGIEPLGPDLTTGWLRERLAGRHRVIKAILLDQSIIAGIGNIYADESLFDAGIRPTRSAESLKAEECEKLCFSIRKTLEHAIEQNGSSFDWAYKGGHFQNEFRVYQRKGEPCPVCGTPIERVVVGQRGTHFCPKCQK
ncbi:MAG: bifunctional DNA-formamidopyrimidine glycosylase/DNA-(apurinic or apyrimidinic site) lyase [Anaerolineaceae bacterium]|nr:bifunctional DNA-formamidopyrimidine glycosylase/DNA-(apurinic or apyrimidinic site) lyase [Anaerolineaceae bacterium]